VANLCQKALRPEDDLRVLAEPSSKGPFFKEFVVAARKSSR